MSTNTNMTIIFNKMFIKPLLKGECNDNQALNKITEGTT